MIRINWEERHVFGDPKSEQPLRVLSSTDTSLFAPMIESFLATQPDVSVEYLVTGTADVDRIIRADPDAFDLVISSAMDLQFKIANDGLAQVLPDVSHPPWATFSQRKMPARRKPTGA